VKLGLQIVRFDWTGSPVTIRTHLADIAGTAEDAGFSSLWVMDHFFQIPWIGAADEPMLEAYTTLGFLASPQIRLGVRRRIAHDIRDPIKTATTPTV
jgi:alkanesulfonate monooxygenase SsuD/methylene tetrahydromethanopterin reductase-like flavin-dependent oxidoreductase (luciferase family)